MRTALLTLTLLVFHFQLIGQTASSGDNYIVSSSDPGRTKTPKVYAPEVSEVNNNLLFSWDAIDLPVGYSVNYEIRIYSDDGPEPIFSGTGSSLSYELETPENYLEPGSRYYVQINSLLSDSEKSYSVKGGKKAFDYHSVPRCTAPENIRIGEKGEDYVVLEWDGTEASTDGIQYEIRMKPAEEQRGTEASSVVPKGISGKMEVLENGMTYIFEVRKLCNRKEAETSKWVQLTYTHQNKTISLPPYVCGEPFFLPDYDKLPEMCPDHDEYGLPEDSVFYIGGFPIYYENLEISDCETTEVPVITVETQVGTIVSDTTYCQTPDTVCQTYYLGYDLTQVGTIDTCKCSVWIPGGDGAPPRWQPISCDYIKPGDSLLIEPCPIYDTAHIYDTVCDTVGWITDICEITQKVTDIVKTDITHYEEYDCGCTYSGEGLVPLPFGKEMVRVRFEGVKVKVELLPFGERRHHIYNKDVAGIPDDPSLYPNYKNPEPKTFGSYCKDPQWNADGTHKETGKLWDPDGFSQGGSYIKEPPYPGYESGGLIDSTGTYDPNGFDKDGNHISGGTTNEYGCTQAQLNSEEPIPPCDSLPSPYAWLDSTGIATPTQAGLVLEQQVRDTLPELVTNALADLLTRFQDTLNGLSPACDSIRGVMRSKVSALGYDSVYIFGPNGEYIEKGMYKNFTKRPEGLAENRFSPREQNTIDLEKSHTALYDCDKGIAIYTQLVATVGDHQNATKIQEIVDELSERLKRLNESEAALLGDPNKLWEWVLAQTEEIIRTANTATYGGISFNEINNAEPGAWAAVEERGEEMRSFAGGYGADPLAMYGIDKAELDELIDNATEEAKKKWAIDGDFDWQPVINPSPKLAALLMQGDPDPTLMPIELKRTVLSKTHTIYLDDIYFSPTKGGFLSAYLLIKHKDTPFVLSAEDVQFMPTGLPSGSGLLTIKNDIEIPISNPALLRIKANERTYAAWSCHGFDGMSIDAEIEFCDKYITPYDKETKKPLEGEVGNVKAFFTAQMPAWGEFYAHLNFNHAFAVNKAKNVVWTISDAYFDFSSELSATNIELPPGYTHRFAENDRLTKAWRGFYLKELSATVSPVFTGERDTPRTIGVQNMLIDDRGFSGTAFMEPVIGLEDANMNGWAFSIDRLEVTIIHNQLKEGHFNGLINVPLFSSKEAPTGGIDPKDCFSYKASFQPNNEYLFAVRMPDNDLNIPMWKAGDVKIDSSSSIYIHYDETSGFDALATLTGDITVSADLGSSLNLDIPKITFENLQLSNKPGYFKSAGIWEMPGELGADFGGFEISLDSIVMGETATGEPALFFGAGLDIGNKGDNIHLTVDGGFRMVGELEMIGEQQRWKFKDFNIDEFYLDGSFPGVPTITGFLVHYGNNPNDPAEYGKGFRGGVHLEIEALKGASATAVGQFGRVDGYKYFFIDVMACVDMPLGGLTLKGAGGGITYKMAKTETINQGLLCNGSTPVVDPYAIGHSLTGAVYTPNAGLGVGLKLTVAMATSDETAFNGNATLEILFNATDSLGEGGGLAAIDLYGNCAFMAPFNMAADPTYEEGTDAVPARNANIKGYFALKVDFNKRYFQGNFEADINSPGGIITGKGAVGVLVSDSLWYFKAGSPNLPIYLRVNVPGFGSIAGIETYLQVGSSIDPMPPLPQEVYDITGATNASDTTRQNKLKELEGNRQWEVSGSSGFGFGMKFAFMDAEKERNFLIFYAKLGLGFGFDVGIRKNNNPNLICTNTGEAPGINGWYAEGQAWALIAAELGIRVRLFGKQRRFSIASLAGAVALQAKLPNPFWMEGAAGIEYNVLNGLVKGKAKFKFQIGELCEYGISSAEDIKLIQSTYPIDSLASPFPVDANPSVTFSFPMNEPIEIRDNNGTLTFDPVIESVELYYREVKENNRLCTEGALSTDGATYTLTPCYMLPGNDTVKMHIRVRIDEDGVKGPVQDSIVTFVTGPALDYIPPTNVAGSYPADGQYNFYKDEVRGGYGYVQLKKGQVELLAKYETDIYARFTDVGENAEEVKAEYQVLDEKLIFPISGGLQNNAMYKMELVEKDARYGQFTSLGAKKSLQESKTIYTIYFRASHYNTFSDKLAAMESSVTNLGPGAYPNNTPPKVTFSLQEPFAPYEMKNLINMNKDKDNLPGGAKLLTLPDEGKYLGMYAKYPVAPVECDAVGANVPEKFRGVPFDKPKPPTDLIFIRTEDVNLGDYVITESMFNTGSMPAWQGTEQFLDVQVFEQYRKDYNYLKPLFESAKGDLEDQYRGYQWPNGDSFSAQDRVDVAKFCIEGKTAIKYSFFEDPPLLPDGQFGYPIYLKYTPPAYNIEPYSVIKIDVPAR